MTYVSWKYAEFKYYQIWTVLTLFSHYIDILKAKTEEGS